MGPDALDADAPDAFYQHPIAIHMARPSDDDYEADPEYDDDDA